MKHYILSALLLVGLVSCHGQEDSDPAHAAVTAYLKKNLDDPSSYQSANWGKQKPFTQQDVDIERAADYLSAHQKQRQTGNTASQHYIDMADLSSTPEDGLAQLAKAKRVLAVFTHRGDSIMALYNKAKASTDTTRLGTVLTHAYRAKNKSGALELDSATFTILRTGKVEMQKL